MKLTITIDDDDRGQPGGEMWPFTLWLDDESGEPIPFTRSGGALIGDDIPTMLREAADQWPTGRTWNGKDEGYGACGVKGCQDCT